MQENDGRAFSFVMIGDLDSVKGSESVHSAPLNTGRPRKIFASLRPLAKTALDCGLRKAPGSFFDFYRTTRLIGGANGANNVVASVRAGSSSLADRVTASHNLHGAAEAY